MIASFQSRSFSRTSNIYSINNHCTVLPEQMKSTHVVLFGRGIPAAAWKNIPSWYVVSKNDHAINPELERFMAKRMGAKVTELETSHVSFISQPAKIAEIIEEAAGMPSQ